jgi:hypothetical protein
VSPLLLLLALPLIAPDAIRPYVERFNRIGPEEVVNAIPDAEAAAWMERNVPRFTCPDPEVEELYYFRWWTYRKHIKSTPKGYILTEFLKPVRHAAEFNAISCAFGHHLAEGRWLRDPRYVEQYARFWLQGGEGGTLHPRFHQFSGWAAAALDDLYQANGRREFLIASLDALLADYTAWESERQLPDGLFWQRDVADGMEESISGGRRVKNVRPTINSYMYANARAIASIATLAGRPEVARTYQAKAARLRQLVQARLWNPRDNFFEAVLETGGFANVREQIGFTPWYFGLPESGRGFEAAWKQLMDPQGFAAPFGITTAEQRHPGFRIANEGDDCQWNGPAWPFATSITLRALGNVLRDYRQTAVTRADYWRTFLTYTHSQHLKLADGREVPWIDENLNPLTGLWQARAMKIAKKTFVDRGAHYNHSTYNDLILTGVVGLRPRADDVVEVSPLLPEGTWDWFAVDNVPYHRLTISIVWDRMGTHFGRGKGLRVWVGGREIAHAPGLERVTGRLPR